MTYHITISFLDENGIELLTEEVEEFNCFVAPLLRGKLQQMEIQHKGLDWKTIRISVAKVE